MTPYLNGTMKALQRWIRFFLQIHDALQDGLRNAESVLSMRIIHCKKDAFSIAAAAKPLDIQRGLAVRQFEVFG